MNSSKWLYDNDSNSYFQKISDSDWIEINKNNIVAKFVETSNTFDSNSYNKPEVILNRGDNNHYVKLVEGKVYWGKKVDQISNILASGRWQIPDQSKESYIKLT